MNPIPAARIVIPEEDRRQILEWIDEALRRGALTLGKNGEAFEVAFARVVGARYAVAVQSGTSALEIILRSLGVEGHEVVVPTNTFFATPAAVIHSGGRPRFADVDRATLALSVDTVAAAISPETVGLGDLWTLGVMRLLGLEFNLANVWALPLIVGTAAEYGLNIYVRYLEGIDGGGPRFPRTVVLGVVLSWLTTMAGFGSLMVAHHHGIFTLGLLLSVGSTASLVAAVFVLPVLIGLFAERSPPSPAA
jgi:hypothetical protein